MGDTVTMGVVAEGYKAFVNDVKKANKDAGKLLLTRLKGVADIIAQTAKSNASWSTRIPGSIRSGATSKGVYVRAGGNKAPHAAAMEGGLGKATFRHPVFGNTDNWVDQPTKPFLLRSLESHMDDVEQAALKAIDDFVAEAGFH